MPQSKGSYSERDMMRMQQDAVARVREMQERAKQTVDDFNADDEAMSRVNRNWSTNPGVQRRGRGMRSAPPPQNTPHTPPPRPDPVPPPPPPDPDPEPEWAPETPPETPPQAPSPEPPPPPPPPKNTTVLQDILGAVGLDDDRLLIIGLIFILINDKADTTLILALCYLLL